MKNRTLLSIDLGSAYTKLAIRRDWHDESQLLRDLPLATPEVDFCVPSVVTRVEGSGGREWLTGAKAAARPPRSKDEPVTTTDGDVVGIGIGLAPGFGGNRSERVAQSVVALDRVIHEMRAGEMAALQEIPFGCYYGSVEDRFDDVFTRPMRPLIDAGVRFELAIGNHDGEDCHAGAAQNATDDQDNLQRSCHLAASGRRDPEALVGHLAHLHPHMREDYAQEMGLYGNILVVPADPDYWPPAHRDVVLTLDDILIEDGVIASFSRSEITHAAMGRFGNVILVGGETDQAFTAQPGEVVRLWLTNTANARVFSVRLPGARMKLVGGDSGRVEHEQFVEEVILAPSERVVVDALFDRAGALTLEHRTPGLGPHREPAPEDVPRGLRLDERGRLAAEGLLAELGRAVDLVQLRDPLGAAHVRGPCRREGHVPFPVDVRGLRMIGLVVRQDEIRQYTEAFPDQFR